MQNSIAASAAVGPSGGSAAFAASSDSAFNAFTGSAATDEDDPFANSRLCTFVNCPTGAYHSADPFANQTTNGQPGDDPFASTAGPGAGNAFRSGHDTAEAFAATMVRCGVVLKEMCLDSNMFIKNRIINPACRR
jgi:hypothetical protein